MRRIYFLIIFISSLGLAQSDYSDAWEDHYAYTNVRDFIKVDSKIYALVDNAVFTYDILTHETEKMSSVNGLSGEPTSSFFYSRDLERLIIGYESGLLEVIDRDGKITLANDIERLNITGKKSINHISQYEDKLYLSTPFAVVVYDIEKLQFGDTYFIGNNSIPVYVNQTMVFNDIIYAVTEEGIFSSDINNPNLVDFNNWNQPSGDFSGNFQALEIFDGRLFAAKNGSFYQVNSPSFLQPISTYSSTILKLRGSENQLAIITTNEALILNNLLNPVATANPTEDFNFTLNSALAVDNTIYLGTTDFGILERSFSDPILHKEIHPDGPISNDIFSIDAMNTHIWVVYGGYDAAYTPLSQRKGFSHFNGENWANIHLEPPFQVRDLVHITTDPSNNNKAYLSSWNDGMLVVEDDVVTTLLNEENSLLEKLVNPGFPDFYSIRINGSAFDNQGNLWVANAWVDKRLKKLASNGTWSEFDLSSIMTNPALGLNELIVDRSGSIWIGTRRNGVLIYNETGDRKRALITEVTKGSLPDPNARTLAVDRNNRIWIGTRKGLVVYANAAGIFDESIYDALPVIIDDDGIAKRLLGEQPVNTIAIDGADNKWFGTENGGVLATNPSGRETLFSFNKNNSPLPSNRIVKIEVDDTDGKVYIATDKGMVAFKSEVAPFGDRLGEVYAYPNPVKKEHNIVTIDGRNGIHLPRGTNVKILDSSGRLVYETNVIEGEELKGGKVVWNKTNLAGRKVASGVYIVLLTLPDRSETSITKIAVIN